ncbi:MAG: hypothetical protein MHMPM18_002070 [Marteilia pararefringens]
MFQRSIFSPVFRLVSAPLGDANSTSSVRRATTNAFRICSNQLSISQRSYKGTTISSSSNSSTAAKSPSLNAATSSFNLGNSLESGRKFIRIYGRPAFVIHTLQSLGWIGGLYLYFKQFDHEYFYSLVKKLPISDENKKRMMNPNLGTIGLTFAATKLLAPLKILITYQLTRAYVRLFISKSV